MKKKKEKIVLSDKEYVIRVLAISSIYFGGVYQYFQDFNWWNTVQVAISLPIPMYFVLHMFGDLVESLLRDVLGDNFFEDIFDL